MFIKLSFQLKTITLFIAILQLISHHTVQSLSILNPTKKNAKVDFNNSFSLSKKSTALDVLNNLNKSSRLATYVKGKANKRQPIAIVTGGSSGIGIPSVETLALSGMKVVLCARNVTAAEKTIKAETPLSLQPKIRIQELDLSDMSSIQAAVEEIVQNECKGEDFDGGIDVLLNNAGVMAPPKRLSTAQGLELQFGTNHVGHHMLTRLLLPYVQNDGRIVTVASSAHSFGSLDFSNLNFDEGDDTSRQYSAWGAYGQSKLANVLFAKSLDDKLKEAGSDIMSVSLHPGVIGTNLWRYSPKWTRPLLNAVVADRNVQQGAATNVFCSLVESSTFKGGEYVSDCEITEPSSRGKDEGGTLRKKLWDATELLITENGYELPEDLY